MWNSNLVQVFKCMLYLAEKYTYTNHTCKFKMLIITNKSHHNFIYFEDQYLLSLKHIIRWVLFTYNPQLSTLSHCKSGLLNEVLIHMPHKMSFYLFII